MFRLMMDSGLTFGLSVSVYVCLRNRVGVWVCVREGALVSVTCGEIEFRDWTEMWERREEWNLQMVSKFTMSQHHHRILKHLLLFVNTHTVTLTLITARHTHIVVLYGSIACRKWRQMVLLWFNCNSGDLTAVIVTKYIPENLLILLLLLLTHCTMTPLFTKQNG